jgi:hypothetical protein
VAVDLNVNKATAPQKKTAKEFTPKKVFPSAKGDTDA